MEIYRNKPSKEYMRSICKNCRTLAKKRKKEKRKKDKSNSHIRWPEVPVQPFCTRNSGLKHQVRGLYVTPYETRRSRKEKWKKSCTDETVREDYLLSKKDSNSSLHKRGSWCSGWLSGLSLRGGRAESRTLDTRDLPSPHNISQQEHCQRSLSQH